MPPLPPSFVDAVEKAIRAMQDAGMVPSIQRLEATMGGNPDMIREATKDLLKQNRIGTLPLDQPQTAVKD